MSAAWQPLPVAPSQLGESPFWHPDEAALYWCDIPGRALHRWHPASQMHTQWPLTAEPGCVVPLPGPRLLLAQRDGLFAFDPTTGRAQRLASPPYDPAQERFNDGRADPQGRLWVGTLFEPRTLAKAALYPLAGGRFERMAGNITVSNGLAFSPDGRTLYWSDTAAHRIDALDFDGADGSISRRRTLAQFAPRAHEPDLAQYAGRPRRGGGGCRRRILGCHV